MKAQSITRYVVTHLNREGIRTLASPMQGRCTYATQEEAQDHLNAIRVNNSPDTLKSLFGLPLEVRPCPCWPGHFDPQTCWFDLRLEVGEE